MSGTLQVEIAKPADRPLFWNAGEKRLLNTGLSPWYRCRLTTDSLVGRVEIRYLVCVSSAVRSNNNRAELQASNSSKNIPQRLSSGANSGANFIRRQYHCDLNIAHDTAKQLRKATEPRVVHGSYAQNEKSGTGSLASQLPVPYLRRLLSRTLEYE